MYRIRPIRAQDFVGFKEIAIASGPGFTSLPVDDHRLQQKITRSEQSFSSLIKNPGHESFLFVMEFLYGQNFKASDIHGGNIMMRPATGDLVITDVGHFRGPRMAQLQAQETVDV